MLRVVGAGLPRTGTKSLQAALEQLLGGRCYHMHEVFDHMDHVPTWRAALRGEPVDWDGVLGNYVASVDWPSSAVWAQLAEANPSAVVVLSVRSDVAAWWDSVSSTIVHSLHDDRPPDEVEWQLMLRELFGSLTPDWNNPSEAARNAAVLSAYEWHNAAVRAAIDPSRLVEWRASDGWEPLCAALGLAVPDEPFPKLNSRDEWWARKTARLDAKTERNTAAHEAKPQSPEASAQG
ncbi:MAG TPA: sulfotransferase [Candidatus Limnocylindrales bacterium]|nr:sulfotransferase [Candidatus Limnocylindrales bacterium]